MTPGRRRIGPAHLGPDAVYRHAFTTTEAGEVWVALTLAAPGTCWGRGESAVLRLDVDETNGQHLILAGGAAPTEYRRLLGRLPAGRHMMRLAFEPRVSTSGRPAVLHRVAVRRVGDAHPSAAVWRHAPVIHYRALAGPLDSATTDTPLLLCYRERPARAEGQLTALEYHVVFSHEDAGTDLTGLLARWGHTLDIEWVLRVTMDRAGRVVSEEFQGAHHRSVRYTGGRVFGGHPVLQVATRNGTFSDRRRSRYRGALAPAWRQPEGEPREAVLQRFPWISHLSAVEIRREGTLERVPRPERDAPADPRAYVFLQWKRRRGPLVALEAAVRVRGVWYTSAWERRPLAFEGPDAESTAVKLPAGTTEDAIDAIALSAFDPPREGVEVRLVRAFLLDGGDRPRPSFVRAADCRLTGAGGRHLVWQRG